MSATHFSKVVPIQGSAALQRTSIDPGMLLNIRMGLSSLLSISLSLRVVFS